jgi:hypothetical protein
MTKLHQQAVKQQVYEGTEYDMDTLCASCSMVLSSGTSVLKSLGVSLLKTFYVQH